MRKEIIYFLPDADAGVTSVVRNLLKYKKKSDLYYKVIFTRLVEREAVHVKDYLDADEQIVFSYNKGENLYAIARRLREHVSTDKSILVANDGLELRMVQLLKMNNPLVYIMHGDFNFYYGLAKQNQGIIDQYIVISQFLKHKLTEVLDQDIPSKIDIQYFPVAEKSINLKREKTIDLIFVGSLDERKGVQFLFEIYKKIQVKISNVNFTIIGSGELENQLQEQFKSELNVSFLGQLDSNQVSLRMENSRVLIFPSLAEGLPNVVVEAMKSNCVAVCSDIASGIPDLIDNDITGYRVAIGDVNEFANRAIYLLENELKRDEISVNAHSKALKMFNPQRNAMNYEILIKNTTANSKTFLNKTLGGILNQSYLPNNIVKYLRRLNISPKL